MSAMILDCALVLAKQKVRFFPVIPNSKKPAVNDFSRRATDDPAALNELFGTTNYNSGIACGKVSEGLYLVGFDIDNKDGRNGYETLELLADLGEEFPETWSQKTPSGGEHRLFWSPVPIRQGTNTCGAGIDLRGEGGYLVGPGSTLDGISYVVLRHLPIALFPAWAIKRWEKVATVHSIAPTKTTGKPVENQIYALKQSIEFLQSQDPATMGNRSDECFRVTAKLKDFGLVREQVVDVLLAHWRCEPMLDDAELHFTTNNAYKYSKSAAGISAPENIFSTVEETPDPIEEDPLDKLNSEFFYCAANGVTRVCWETKREGKFHLERFPVFAFHEKYGAEMIHYNGKEHNLTEVWLKSKKRRTYDYMRFDPSSTLETNTYNLWRGFAVTAAEVGTKEAEEGVAFFIEHCRKNVCAGDTDLFNWLFNFMAHIFQNPGEKPEVSLVFRGKKGTGKTIVSEILNHLIGDNSVILSDKTHVVGHFNSMMEDKLLVTLDEAFWSGDKAIEGVLKDVITGSTRVITHKGAEPYKARVYDRIVIIGNEEWLVPASADERRFAVFTIGEGRRQDRKFFGAMKRGLFENGGDRLLMGLFRDHQVDRHLVHCAPQTEGLADQKLQSLGPFQRWWYSCLLEGEVLGSGVEGWPDHFACHDFYAAFVNQMQNERSRAHLPTRIGAGMIFKHLSKNCGGSKIKGGKRVYDFAPLELAREEFSRDNGFATQWD